jgi:hypothetical protein
MNTRMIKVKFKVVFYTNVYMKLKVMECATSRQCFSCFLKFVT